MTSFRDVQNLLLFSHGSNFIEDEEFLILYDLFEPRNPDFPHEAYAKFAKNINVLIFSSSLVFDLI